MVKSDDEAHAMHVSHASHASHALHVVEDFTPLTRKTTQDMVCSCLGSFAYKSHLTVICNHCFILLTIIIARAGGSHPLGYPSPLLPLAQFPSWKRGGGSTKPQPKKPGRNCCSNLYTAHTAEAPP